MTKRDGSRFWRRAYPLLYETLKLIDPLLRRWWRVFGLGNVVELVVPGRRSGKSRSVLVGLLQDGDRLFLGHPDRNVAWTSNLEAAREGELRFANGAVMPFRAEPLPDGEQREAAIRCTWTQHPFPGDLLYRLGRGHVRAVGVFFRLHPIRRTSSAAQPSTARRS